MKLKAWQNLTINKKLDIFYSNNEKLILWRYRNEKNM